MLHEQLSSISSKLRKIGISTMLQNVVQKNCRNNAEFLKITQNWNFDNGVASTCEIMEILLQNIFLSKIIIKKIMLKKAKAWKLKFTK